MSISYANLAEMLRGEGMTGGIYNEYDETHSMFVEESQHDSEVEGFLSDIVGGDINIYGGIGSIVNIENSDDNNSSDDESQLIIEEKNEEDHSDKDDSPFINKQNEEDHSDEEDSPFINKPKKAYVSDISKGITRSMSDIYF